MSLKPSSMITLSPLLNRSMMKKNRNGVHLLRTDLLELIMDTLKEMQQDLIKIKLLKRLISMKLELYLVVGMVVRNSSKYVDL